MNPNSIYGWHLFFANQGKYTFKNKENEKIEITVTSDSYDEAKDILIKFIKSEEQNSV